MEFVRKKRNVLKEEEQLLSAMIRLRTSQVTMTRSKRKFFKFVLDRKKSVQVDVMCLDFLGHLSLIKRQELTNCWLEKCARMNFGACELDQNARTDKLLTGKKITCMNFGTCEFDQDAKTEQIVDCDAHA